MLGFWDEEDSVELRPKTGCLPAAACQEAVQGDLAGVRAEMFERAGAASPTSEWTPAPSHRVSP